jgi:hypothetical protein
MTRQTQSGMAVPTSIGLLTVSPLTSSEAKELAMFILTGPKRDAFRFLGFIHCAIAKLHPGITLERLESGLTAMDYGALLDAVLALSDPGQMQAGKA